VSEAGTARRLAVLIDADNVTADAVKALLQESIAKFGIATIRRAYGDWTEPRLAPWKKVLLEHAVQPMQQFANRRGKNATDSAMIIDAMDLLYTRRLDGFCIVSSDSDFTALARRIREDGLFVLGCGEAKTHDSLRAACSEFIEIGSPKAEPGEAAARAAPAHKPKKASEPTRAKRDSAQKPGETQRAADLKLTAAIRDELKRAGKDDAGWISLSLLGKALAKNDDYKRLSPNRGGLKKIMAASQGAFEIETRGKTDYIRDSRAPS